MRYTNKIPMVRNSWKHVPSVPRIDVSAYSLMKTGQTTHDPPIPIPVLNEIYQLRICEFRKKIILQKKDIN